MLQSLSIPLARELRSGENYLFDQDVLHIHASECREWIAEIRRAREALPTAFLLEGKRDITLDLGGATMLLHGLVQPFVLERCENITIQNASILCDRPTYTEATVLEVGDGFLRLRLNPNHPCRVEDGRLVPYSDSWENRELDHTYHFLQCFDGETHEGRGLLLVTISPKPVHFENCPWTIHQYAAEQEGSHVILRGPIFPCYKPGSVIVIAHGRRNHSVAMMRNCRNIRLRNLRIHNGLGMGILPIHCQDLFLDRVRYQHDPSSPGLVTNAADALHAFACGGRFELTDCVFEGMIDDAVNIHGQFFTLDKAEGARAVLNTRLQGETAMCTIFADGDRIGIHRGKTTEVEREYAIVATRILDDNHIEVTLDQPVWGGHSPDSLVENLSAQPDLTMRRCVFRNANSHLRIQTAGKVRIEDCEIGLPLWLTGDASYWFESSGVRDMAVRGTAFTTEAATILINPQVLPTEKEPYYHRNIRVEGCSFHSDRPVEASLADNIVFVDNTQAEGRPMTLKLTNCGDATAPGCVIERHTERKDSLSIN